MAILDEYLKLIRDFVAGEMDADAFESAYVDLWYKALDGFLSQQTPETKIIAALFLEVDAYSNDPGLGESYCLDADGLRAAAQKALDELVALRAT